MEITLAKSLLIAVVLAPLFGSIIAGLFGRQVGRLGAQTITILGVAVSCALSMYVFYQLLWGGAQPFNENLYTFFEVGQYSAHVGFMVDKLTAMMMVVVTFVSLLVHIYTIGYMEEDPGYQRFFSYISLFTFSMLTLVMSNNFLQLFFGWEAVGLVSYLLIGFWFKRPTAIFANMKAFLVNRVGDFGFLLGIGGVLWVFGTLDYATVFAKIMDPELANGAIQVWSGSIDLFGLHTIQVLEQPVVWASATVICICLFIGAMGKSAQVPLHVWLPDSMEGPTPISALIHAATMVTAGIFMVTRMSPLFELSPTALNFVLFIGATTAFFTGLIGIVQNDIKRVVAYSTLSQLGYMTVALGVSAYSAAVFHLMTHAFFKALLFLGAGSVIIAMHHEQDMRRMGGLRKYMPITFITMWIGTLALVGTPFFSGFYSKDTIIEAAEIHAHMSSSWVATYAYWAVLGGVLVTSFYSFRLLFLTFHGKERFRDVAHDDHGHGHDAHAHDDHAHAADAHHADAHADHGHDDHGHGHGPHEPHETPWVVTLPLILLAIPSIIIGFFSIGPMLHGTDWAGHHAHEGIKGQATNFFTGIVDFYDPAKNTVGFLGEHFHGPVAFALHGMTAWPFFLTVAGFLLAVIFYLWKPDLSGRARRTFAPIVSVLENKYGMDTLWIDGFAGGSVKLGRVARWLDTNIVDGTVNLVARGADVAANVLRRTQSGFLYHYAFAMIIGLIALLGLLMHYLR
ncbi:MAG: NADH-quinone oxidoreductase subunit L [Stenotrophomonas sp.]|uniref:NADH-quinone oxidoreductase subunit L n=1 Tax=Stenotrophomonas TaxID=40323 RepID=UPI000C322FC7|nr:MULTISPECIES: NADH-quinone oxidoreductase subunit L [Stenotrophomonas]MDX3932049.1 NADH-quinone oxidoreductase subunit L [Stenotrophomonas sp.]PKH72183.1 NADH-quinone oxidoreductase subunit L [Stenotrophomonas sp. Betaine-02u-23]PKH73536.1 NADH-quinone oxidoreductase subunit L [Stenotrophomonas sp. Betaine-02u-21]PKH94905.1 NADH-quinone oxidoreductase subunit L [Stenotrophomonas sp. Bg11-02]